MCKMMNVLTCTDALRLLGTGGGQDTCHLGGGCCARRCFWRRSFGPCSTSAFNILHNLLRTVLSEQALHRAVPGAPPTRLARRGRAPREAGRAGTASLGQDAVRWRARGGKGARHHCWTELWGVKSASSEGRMRGKRRVQALGAAPGGAQVPHMALGSVSTFKSFPLTSGVLHGRAERGLGFGPS